MFEPLPKSDAHLREEAMLAAEKRPVLWPTDWELEQARWRWEHPSPIEEYAHQFQGGPHFPR